MASAFTELGPFFGIELWCVDLCSVLPETESQRFMRSHSPGTGFLTSPELSGSLESLNAR